MGMNTVTDIFILLQAVEILCVHVRRFGMGVIICTYQYAYNLSCPFIVQVSDPVHEGGRLHKSFPRSGAQRFSETVSGGVPESKHQPQHSLKIATKPGCECLP